MFRQPTRVDIARLIGRAHRIVAMKAIMTRIAGDMMMDKYSVATGKAFDRFANCYDFTGWFVTELARHHAIFPIDLFQIRATQPTCSHFDKNVTDASHLRHFDIIHRNRAGPLYKDCLHLLFHHSVLDINNECC
jgi:hypothetical protein